jgi:tetratricopeptide (TPR) repeat protein
MSLLIKALASAEKDKKAGGRAAEAPLTLELAPIDDKLVTTSDQNIAANVAGENEIDQLVIADAAYKSSETTRVTDVFPENYLSLVEEAGLTEVPVAANKYAKLKAGSAKGSSQDVSLVKKPANKATSPLPKALTLQSPTTQTVEISQKAAAKVFVANQATKTPSSKFALGLVGVVGALMILLGLQGYTYYHRLAAPELVVVKPVKPIQPPADVVTENVPATAVQPEPISLAVLPQEMPVAAVEGAVAKAETKSKNKIEPELNKHVAKHDVLKKLQIKESKDSSDESPADNEVPVRGASESLSKHAPVKLISRAQTVGVDPTLLSAYQAFSRGESASAQQQYRQVLQLDVRNVDALLGMAAIAQRQGRDADAQGWYQKVLEIEPRNTIAQSAIISPQAHTDAIGTESRIKGMLAQQPEAANLHASLGNLYAEQGQWPSAQEAFFNASRFAPNNADYAFNLAISLDQMGKSNLALKQYQRALELLNKSGASSPDRAQLEARIKALQ